MTLATIGTRYQVVIPREERRKIGLRPKDKVAVSVKDGAILVRPVGKGRLRGLGKEIADATDATDYVRRIRAEWEERQ